MNSCFFLISGKFSEHLRVLQKVRRYSEHQGYVLIFSFKQKKKTAKLPNALRNKKEEGGEDGNFHLQSLRDAPLPPIMYTGIFI